jgi:hypothetical protein
VNFIGGLGTLLVCGLIYTGLHILVQCFIVCVYILLQVERRLVGGVWSGFTWLRIGTVGGLL